MHNVLEVPANNHVYVGDCGSRDLFGVSLGSHPNYAVG